MNANESKYVVRVMRGAYKPYVTWEILERRVGAVAVEREASEHGDGPEMPEEVNVLLLKSITDVEPDKRMADVKIW